MNRTTGKPRLVLKDDPFYRTNKTEWIVDLYARCPTCKKIFMVSNTHDTPDEAMAVPRDEMGFYRTECCVECFDDETKRKIEDARIKFCEENGINEKEVTTRLM